MDGIDGMKEGMVQIPTVLLPCRVATIVTLVITSGLTTSVFGGVPLRPRLDMPGIGACTTIAANYTGETTAVSRKGFQFDVSGISSLYDYSRTTAFPGYDAKPPGCYMEVTGCYIVH